MGALHAVDPLALIGAARASLFRMAENCLNTPRMGHALDLDVVRLDLDEAIDIMAPCRLREAVGRVRAELGVLDVHDRALALDDLGSIYHLAELRLARVELALIETGHAGLEKAA